MLVEIFPILIRLLAFSAAVLCGVVLGHVLPEYEEELAESGGFADSADPQQEYGEMGVFNVDFSFGVVLNQLLDVHETELIHHLFFWSHGVS